MPVTKTCLEVTNIHLFHFIEIVLLFYLNLEKLCVQIDIGYMLVVKNFYIELRR
jgi:hypothetical protein